MQIEEALRRLSAFFDNIHLAPNGANYADLTAAYVVVRAECSKLEQREKLDAEWLKIRDSRDALCQQVHAMKAELEQTKRAMNDWKVVGEEMAQHFKRRDAEAIALALRLDAIRNLVWADLPLGGIPEQFYKLRKLMEPPK